MKKVQSVICALALALSLSSTVFAGDIHGIKATAPGDIHGAYGILLTDVFSWGDITGAIVSVFGVVLAD